MSETLEGSCYPEWCICSLSTALHSLFLQCVSILPSVIAVFVIQHAIITFMHELIDFPWQVCPYCRLTQQVCVRECCVFGPIFFSGWHLLRYVPFTLAMVQRVRVLKPQESWCLPCKVNSHHYLSRLTVFACVLHCRPLLSSSHDGSLYRKSTSPRPGGGRPVPGSYSNSFHAGEAFPGSQPHYGLLVGIPLLVDIKHSDQTVDNWWRSRGSILFLCLI